MSNEYKSVKVLQDDHKTLRLLAAKLDLQIYQVVGEALECFEGRLRLAQDANQIEVQSSEKK